MSPYLGDFWRHISSIALIASVVAGCVVGATFGVANAPAPVISSFTYYYDQGYHLLFFVGSETGLPIPGAAVSVQMTLPAVPPAPAGREFNEQITTDSSGLARLYVQAPASNYSVTFSVRDSEGTQTESWFVTPGPTGSTGVGANDLQPARVGFLSTSAGLFAFFSAPSGQPPIGYAVDYSVVNISQIGNPPPLSKATHAGTLSGYYGTFPLSLPSNVTSNSSLLLAAEIVAANGTVVATSDLTIASFASSGAPTDQASRALSFMVEVLGSLVAIAGTFLAYVAYGRDRTTKTIEAVLWRPVTSSGLLSARFGTAVVGVAAMASLSVIVLNWSMESQWRVSFSPSFVLVMVGAEFATGTAFVGMVFVCSRLFKNHGRLVASMLILLAGFVLLWGTVELAIVGNQPTFGTESVLLAVLNNLNPYLIPSVAVVVSTSGSYMPNVGAWGGLSSGAMPLVACAALWCIIPYIASFWMARIRD
jgi:ABC-type transport system involved in multi-copper enzyme maturation permease subunit